MTVKELKIIEYIQSKTSYKNNFWNKFCNWYLIENKLCKQKILELNGILKMLIRWENLEMLQKLLNYKC